MTFIREHIPWNKGLHYSDEQKKNVVLANKNINKRKKLGQAVKNRIEKLGYRYTLEQRENWSKSMKMKGIKPKSRGWNKGLKQSDESNAKRREWNNNNLDKLKYWKGRKQSQEMIAKRVQKVSGEKHYNWKGGLSNRDIHSLYNPHYKKWRMSVFMRDQFKCKIANEDCQGGIQAHHILRWSKYVELRYEINNGITLCQFHHPRKQMKEQRLIPVFRKLVGSNTY